MYTRQCLITLCLLIFPLSIFAQQDSVNIDGPDFHLKKEGNTYRMRQVFPSSPPARSRKESRTQGNARLNEKEYETLIGQSKDGEWKSEIHAMVNPADTTNIIAMTMNSPQGMTVYTSKDFGKSWLVTYTMNLAGDPILTADADGKIYIFFLAIVNGDVNLYYRYSLDKGSTWITPVHDSVNGGNHGTDKEWVVVDRTHSPYRNTIYAAMYSDIPGTDRSGIILRKKLPTSDAFSDKTIIIADSGFAFSQLVTIDVAPDGSLHAVFSGTTNDSENVALWHTVSRDGGETFEPAQKITSLSSRVIQFFGLACKIPGFRSIFGSQLVAAHDNAPESQKNNLYVVWHTLGKTQDTATSADIYFTRSTDGGKNWSTPFCLNSSPGTKGRYHYLPTITITSQGILCVSWYDGSSASANTSVNTSVVYSRDGGMSFSPPVQVNALAANLNTMEEEFSFTVGHYTQIACTDHYAIPFWSDGRSGTSFSLYCAFVPFTSISSVERIEKLNNHSAQLDISPNPVLHTATLTMTLQKAAHTKVVLTDLRGTEVTTLLDRDCPVGKTPIALDNTNIASGTYFCSVLMDGSIVTTTKIEIER